ncbi:hypothetical protein GCM10023085_28360 [Actinomadura viridis]|uniref:DUF4245 domain-containing protein n=1 Tax=Actinomadura viridis TaxID=58110 RepID=A0A931DEK3_9ACTN|nr:DUF4245 domain-containing protein [Actinomadura viridis]MBG6087178.1 hypothetical protein [Actinomadura viridis]
MTDKTSSPSTEPAPGAESGTAPASEPAGAGDATTGADAATGAPEATGAAEGAAGGKDAAAPAGGPTAAEAGPQAAGSRGTVQVSPGVYKRLTTGLGGFTLAMAACLLLVGAIFLVTPRGEKEVLPTIDYGGHLWAMRSGAPYTVHAPEGLPAGWRPTSSRVHGLNNKDGEPVAWHLGFLTPTDQYAALEQSNEKPSAYIPRMTNIKKTVGTRQVGGATWNQYHRKDKNAYSLARTLPGGVTLVVTGTASFDELAVLAGALKAQSRQGGVPAATTSPAPRS